jgi:hypothetical protein
MKTQKILFILSTVLILAFVNGDKSFYTIPQSPWTIYVSDIDLDGDCDVLVGHKYSSNSGWGGVSLLTNQGSGIFNFSDSLYFDNGFSNISGGYFDSNSLIDVFSTTVTTNPYTIHATVIYNYGQTQFDSIKSFPIYSTPPVPFITHGDVNGDGYDDLLFAYNNDFLWGIIYNDGTGNFPTPEYFGLAFPPIDIDCADLNDDGRDDVIIAGEYSSIFFSYVSGFEQQSLGYTWTTGCNVLVCDIDNDNMKDILIVGGVEGPHTRIYMFKNTGNNQFQHMPDFEFDPLTQYAQTADFNNDSLPDIVFCAHDNSGLFIYRNDGDFQLTDQKYIPIENNNAMLRRVECADFDGNYYCDLVIIKSWGGNYEGNIMFIFNDGQGNFVDDPIITQTEQTEDVGSGFIYYLNPFSTTINFRLNTNVDSEIILCIYDLAGNLVYESSEYSHEVESSFTWDATNISNRKVNPGAYLAVIYVNNTFYKSMKILLI